MSEPGLFVGRKAHQPSESVNQAKNQSRERQQLQRSGPRRPVAQSFAAPLKPKFMLLGVHDSLDATLTRRFSQRRGSRAAEQRDELAAPHSITSSASASSLSGMSRPSIRAVWALMTSSNLLDCTTGKSAGLAPLRMRPA